MQNPRTEVVVSRTYSLWLAIGVLLIGGCVESPEVKNTDETRVLGQEPVAVVNPTVELEEPEIDASANADSAPFSVTLNSPQPYAPIGEGLISVSASLSGTFDLASLRAEVSVEGLSSALPLTLATDGSATFEGEADLRGVYEGDLVFPLISVRVTDEGSGASAQASTRVFIDRTETITLSASPSSIVAGDEVVVSCLLTVGGETADDELVLDVLPTASAINRVGPGRWFVRLESAQPHRFRCETLDGVARSSESWIDVRAAELDTLVTSVDQTLSLAGERFIVSCDGTDVYGNAITPLDGVSIEGPLNSVVVELGQGRFGVSIGALGTWNYRCLSSAVSDPIGVDVEVVPNIVTATQTTVSRLVIRPTDEVGVNCGYFDRFGHPIDTATGTFVVVPATGESAATYGLVIDGDSFSATRTGYFWVSCVDPATGAEDPSPVLVELRAGKPFVWIADVFEQDCYWQDRELPLSIYVYDRWSNLVAEPGLSISSVPAGALTGNWSDGWRIATEGDYSVTLEVTEELDPDALIEPYQFDLRVDSTPPTIAFDGYQRGQFITSGGSANQAVSVDGTFFDGISEIIAGTFDEGTLSIDGTSNSFSFTESFNSRWGTNVLAASAEDACGNVAVRAQSFIRSGEYAPARTVESSNARVTSGLVGHLNQPVIDDGDRSDIDDIATLAQEVVAQQNLDEAIPNPITDSIGRKYCDCLWPINDITTDDTGFRVTKNGTFQYDPLQVNSIKAVAGGIKFQGAMTGIDLPLRVRGVFHEGCFIVCTIRTALSATVDGNVLVDRVDVNAEAAISLSGGNPSVSFTNFDISFVNLRISIDWGILSDIGLGGLLDDLTNTILDIFEPEIESALSDQIRDSIGPLLEDFIGDFGVATDFTIPEPVGLNVALSTGLDRIEFAGPEGTGYGQLGLYTQVYPASRGTTIDSSAPGAAKDGGALPSFDRGPYSFGVGLRDDLINQVLWAVWYGGGLSLDDPTALVGGGFDGVSLSIDALTPPVLMKSDTYDLELGLGDLYVDASIDLGDFGTLDVGAYVSVVAGAFVDLDPTTNQLIFSFADTPSIWVDVASLPEPAFQGPVSQVLTGVLEQIVPELIGSIVGSIPIPEFDIGNLAGLPNSTVWRLNNGSLERTDSAIKLTGSLE